MLLKQIQNSPPEADPCLPAGRAPPAENIKMKNRQRSCHSDPPAGGEESRRDPSLRLRSELRMTPGVIFTFFIAILIFAFLILIWSQQNSKARTSVLDPFAQCLRDKGVTMYGADWCPHCQNEKKVFGSSFRFIPYIECPKEPNKCLAAGIEGFPTWVFPASPAGGPDGRKLEGEQGLERLAAASGCELE